LCLGRNRALLLGLDSASGGAHGVDVLDEITRCADGSRLPGRCRSRGGFCCRHKGCSIGAVSSFDFGYRGSHGHGFSFLSQDLQKRAVDRGRYFHGYFVGYHLDQRLKPRQRVAGLF